MRNMDFKPSKAISLSLNPLSSPQQLFSSLEQRSVQVPGQPLPQTALPLQKQDHFKQVSLLVPKGDAAPQWSFTETNEDSVAAPDMTAVEKGQAMLVEGQEGAAVVELQRLLTEAGYPLEADGDFGNTTEGKLKHFQKDHGITINGHLGKTTLSLLKSVANKSVQATAAGARLVSKAKQVVREMGTVGWCYTGVARSVSRAFGVELYGNSAYMADSQLRRSSKFKEVKNVAVNDLKKMPVGTVVVWDRAPASSGNRGRGGGWDHGHIAVLDGKGGEYSDHYRSRMFAPHYAGGAIRGVFVPV
jgi:hypothetical protein